MSLTLVSLFKWVFEALNGARFRLVSRAHEDTLAFGHNAHGSSLAFLLETKLLSDRLEVQGMTLNELSQRLVLYSHVHLQRSTDILLVGNHRSDLQVLKFVLPDRILLFRLIFAGVVSFRFFNLLMWLRQI